MPPSATLREGLKAVIDPEIGYNIVDLGLVYDVEKPEPGHVHVRMTLTAMGCPLTEVIHQQCTMVMLAFPGVESADVATTRIAEIGEVLGALRHVKADFLEIESLEIIRAPRMKETIDA